LKLLSSAASLVEERTPVKYAVLAGRQLFSAIFIIASARHFSPQTIDAAAGHGVPLPGLLVPLSGIIALLGGLSILFGFHTRFGAGLLVIFLVPVTLAMHNFWSVSDPMTHQIEIAMFMKNVTMLGGALVISYFGAGPLSLDALLSQRKDSSHDASLVSAVPEVIPHHSPLREGSGWSTHIRMPRRLP
jgi:putative oxidoreductase